MNPSIRTLSHESESLLINTPYIRIMIRTRESLIDEDINHQNPNEAIHIFGGPMIIRKYRKL